MRSKRNEIGPSPVSCHDLSAMRTPPELSMPNDWFRVVVAQIAALLPFRSGQDNRYSVTNWGVGVRE